MRYVRVDDGTVVNATVFGAVASGGGGGGDGGVPDTMPDGWDAPNVWIASDVAQIGWTYRDGSFAAPPPKEPAAPSAGDVWAERDRRLALGFNYDFGDARGVHHIGTSPADMVGWDDVTTYANALVATGDTTTTINILTDTGPTQVTAPEWQQILLAAAAVRQPVWQASFVLAAMSPIPADYTADGHWP